MWLIVMWKEAEFSTLKECFRISVTKRSKMLCPLLRHVSELQRRNGVSFCSVFSCWINLVTHELPEGVLTSAVLCFAKYVSHFDTYERNSVVKRRLQD